MKSGDQTFLETIKEDFNKIRDKVVRIKEIIEAEDRKSPLSDEEVVRILRERDGVKVARRTVTKYRLAMGIPSSSMRRSY